MAALAVEEELVPFTQNEIERAFVAAPSHTGKAQEEDEMPNFLHEDVGYGEGSLDSLDPNLLADMLDIGNVFGPIAS